MASPGVLASFEFNATYLHSLRQGDPSVEEHFVSHFSPILLRKLRRKLRSTEQAYDLRQETFLRVLTAVRSGRSVRHPERFEIFVLGVCKNVLRETYRQRKPLAPMEPELEPASNAPGPDACTLAEETARYVRRVLARMDSNDRAILQAAFLEEQDKDEICLRFGISRNYLRLLIFRAKKEFEVCAQREMRKRTGLRICRPRKPLRHVFTLLKPRPVVPTSGPPRQAPVFLPAAASTQRSAFSREGAWTPPRILPLIQESHGAGTKWVDCVV